MIRNWLFDIGILKSVDVGVPVISVGNITAGGTGKTPIVENIAKIFIEQGKKVAIVSRGFGRASRGTVVVSDGKNILAKAKDAGDEPLYLAQRFNSVIVVVDEQRVRGAQLAVTKYGAEIILLDDGFQHRYLKRDIDIVLMDSQNSPFVTSLLPAGYRREPLRSLQRANAIIWTKVKRLTGRPLFSSS